MTDLTEKTLATERKYTGKIVSVDLLDIELPDGRKAKREVIRHGNAVAILARRPDGKFVFVRQYRKAAQSAAWWWASSHSANSHDIGARIHDVRRNQLDRVGPDDPDSPVRVLSELDILNSYERIRSCYIDMAETLAGRK